MKKLIIGLIALLPLTVLAQSDFYRENVRVPFGPVAKSSGDSLVQFEVNPVPGECNETYGIQSNQHSVISTLRDARIALQNGWAGDTTQVLIEDTLPNFPQRCFIREAR